MIGFKERASTRVRFSPRENDGSRQAMNPVTIVPRLSSITQRKTVAVMQCPFTSDFMGEIEDIKNGRSIDLEFSRDTR